MPAPWKESYNTPRQHIKKQRHLSANKSPYSQLYDFSKRDVQMWVLDHKKGRAAKNWCFQIVVLEKILESPLVCTEIKPVNPKGSQPWIFIGRTDAEDEPPILWPPHAKSKLIGKDPDVGKNGRQEEKGTTEGKMVRWLHQLNGHQFEQAPEDEEGQGSLACCSPWGGKESDMTGQLNNNKYYHFILLLKVF